jgi:hypothetical protein
MHMKSLSLRVLVCVSTLANAATITAASPAGDGVAVVASLYREFAWEVLANEPLGGEPGFIDQPRSVLERYLEPSLATLILEDRACVERTREVCRLDFMPLWNSQDPAPSDLRVGAGATTSEVLVRLRPSPVDEEVSFRFEMVRTAAGLRVHDIVYADDWSLRKALASD